MDSNSVWRFRQKSDWFTAQLYNQITHLLKQHRIHDVNVDLINIRRCQLKPVTSAMDVESEDSLSFYSIQDCEMPMWQFIYARASATYVTYPDFYWTFIEY